MNVCPSCGAANAAGAVQCSICGRAFGAAPQAPTPFGVAPQQPQPFGAPPQQPQPFGAAPQQPQPFGAAPQQPQPFGVAPQQPQPFGAAPQQPQPFGAAPQQPQPFGQPPQQPQPFGQPSGAAPFPSPQTGLDIGSVLSAGFDLTKRTAGVTLPALVAMALPGALVSATGSAMQASSSGPFGGSFASFTLLATGGILTWVLGQIGAGAASHTVLEARAGRPLPSVGAALGTAAPRVGSLLLGTFLSGLAIVVGLLLCIVPGVALAVMLSLTVPVIMAEQRSSVDAMTRSAQLTDGARVDIFAVLFAAGLCSLALVIPLICCSAAMVGGATAAAGAVSPVALFANQLVSGLVGAVIGAFMHAIIVELYARRSGWGAAPDATATAQVFS